MEKRYIGIDLHRNPLTRCAPFGERADVLEGGSWRSGEVRQEAAANRRSGRGDYRQHQIVFRRGGRACGAGGGGEHESISCNPRQSVKKTDANDARLLSLYLSKNLLPEVRMKDKEQAQLASLTQTRDTLVKQRSALKNKVNNILSAREQPAGKRCRAKRLNSGAGTSL